jgi:hypothetical protein
VCVEARIAQRPVAIAEAPAGDLLRAADTHPWMSAMDAVMRDVEVFYVADAMAAYSMNQHLENAEYVSNLCASVQTTKAVVATLSGVYSDTAAG